MISISLKQLVNSADALKNLSQRPLKARCAYTISKLLKATDAEITNFNEVRMNLIKKFGKKNEQGELDIDEQGNVHIPPEDLNKFNTETQELLDTIVEINANKINISDVENIEFTPLEMNLLEEFIDFE